MIFNKKPSNVHYKIAFNLIGFLQRACPKIYLHIFVKTVTTSRAPLSKKVEEECWKGGLHEGASRQWQLHFNFVRMYIEKLHLNAVFYWASICGASFGGLQCNDVCY